MVSSPEMLVEQAEQRFGFVVAHIGSGEVAGKEGLPVINIDIDPASGCDIVAMADNIPVPDACIDGIIAVHLIEHVRPPQASRIVQEWARILRPGAYALVETPDCHTIMRALGRAPKEAFDVLPEFKKGISNVGMRDVWGLVYGNFAFMPRFLEELDPYAPLWRNHKWLWTDRSLRALFQRSDLPFDDVHVELFGRHIFDLTALVHKSGRGRLSRDGFLDVYLKLYGHHGHRRMRRHLIARAIQRWDLIYMHVYGSTYIGGSHLKHFLGMNLYMLAELLKDETLTPARVAKYVLRRVRRVARSTIRLRR